MKINVTCKSCQRIMRVAAEHLGKKGKCPKCGTVNLIKEDSPSSTNQPPEEEVDALPVDDPLPVVEPLPIAEPIASYPQPQAKQPQGNLAFGQSDFNTQHRSPYQAPNAPTGPNRQNPNPNPTEADIPGILSVVAGGLSLLGLCLCMCFSPVVIFVVLFSIGGITLAFFAKPPMKIIGLCLNGFALAITIAIVIIAVVFFIFLANSTPTPNPGFRGPMF